MSRWPDFCNHFPVEENTHTHTRDGRVKIKKKRLHKKGTAHTHTNADDNNCIPEEEKKENAHVCQSKKKGERQELAKRVSTTTDWAKRAADCVNIRRRILTLLYHFRITRIVGGHGLPDTRSPSSIH